MAGFDEAVSGGIPRVNRNGSAMSQQEDLEPMLRVSRLSVSYAMRKGLFGRLRDSRRIRAVDDVSFSIAKGETFGLVGESGCGKSSLMRAVLGLEDATGEIFFKGSDILTMRRRELLGYKRAAQPVLQDPSTALNPRMKISEIIAEPLIVHGVGSPAERKKRVRELMGLVGLRPEYADAYPRQFSGGQRQRISIARALAISPEFLLLDEATSSLDVSIQAQVLNLLIDLKKELDLTYLFVGHNLEVVRHMSDRIGVMYLGKLVEVGTPDEIYTAPRHPYTQALIAAAPSAARALAGAKTTRKKAVVGELPSPSDEQVGCRFRSRCWLYKAKGEPEVCAEVDPEYAEFSATQVSACHFADEVSESVSS